MNPAFFVAEIALVVLVLVMIAEEDALIRFERKVGRWLRRMFRTLLRRIKARKTDAFIHELEELNPTVYPAPAMTAEEIVKVCDSL